MKKSKLLASVALTGVILGAQVALANHHEEGTKEEKGKHSCNGKEKHSCEGKKMQKEGTNNCSGMNGCDGKMNKEHPAAPEHPKKD
jgi:hypothetical protein